MRHSATILMTEFVTHDVKRFILTRPRNFDYEPGQGVKIVINEPRWRGEEGRPFTPTSPRDDKILEFTIKRYPGHKGVTDRLHSLEVGAKLMISEAFGIPPNVSMSAARIHLWRKSNPSSLKWVQAPVPWSSRSKWAKTFRLGGFH